MTDLYVADRNRKWVLEAGAQEFGSKHYPLFFILHLGWLMGWIGEVSFYGSSLSELWYLWFGIFVAALGLRYWCITSLGKYWNTRILVVPGIRLIRTGPYRFLRHPNYIVVALELVSVPMIFGAVITASIATVMNAYLLLGIRIPAEERALRLMK